MATCMAWTRSVTPLVASIASWLNPRRSSTCFRVAPDMSHKVADGLVEGGARHVSAASAHVALVSELLAPLHATRANMLAAAANEGRSFQNMIDLPGLLRAGRAGSYLLCEPARVSDHQNESFRGVIASGTPIPLGPNPSVRGV